MEGKVNIKGISLWLEGEVHFNEEIKDILIRHNHRVGEYKVSGFNLPIVYHFCRLKAFHWCIISNYIGFLN